MYCFNSHLVKPLLCFNLITTPPTMSNYCPSWQRNSDMPVQNNKVVVPPAIADGSFMFLPLPNGLHACITNCTFNQDWLIHRKRSINGEYYILRFDELVIPGTLIITIDDEKLKEKNTSKSIAYLTSSHFDWSYLGTAGGKLSFYCYFIQQRMAGQIPRYPYSRGGTLHLYFPESRKLQY